MQNLIDYINTQLVPSILEDGETIELLNKIINLFPYAIEVFDSKGTAVLVNQEALIQSNIPSADLVIGKYNFLDDPSMGALGLHDKSKLVYEDGETVHITDIKVPIESINKRYNVKDYDISSMYQDITAFPIKDEENNVCYMVVIMITRKIYRGKEEITRSLEYIENHWMEKFDINKLANEVNLSTYYFSRLFKKHMGITPHVYYTNIKINKIKDKLLDMNLSVSEAFSACGVDYHGHFAKVFKEKIGVTPSKYRQENLSKQKEGI